MLTVEQKLTRAWKIFMTKKKKARPNGWTGVEQDQWRQEFLKKKGIKI